MSLGAPLPLVVDSPIAFVWLKFHPWVRLLVSKGELKRHEYADVILEVDGKEPLTLFAHVVNVRSALVHLRWLHFEPGEEAALAVKLKNSFQLIRRYRV